jgi:chorismate dehydratase
MNSSVRRLSIGSVSYLNARPLIHGLDVQPDIDITLDVPSKLIDGLRDNRFDVALLPVIDFQRLPGLTILPAGGIGCDGPTLTVRLFSRTPIETTRTLACDPDSHTSVALARIILAEQMNIRPELIDLRNARDVPGETRLLIGDKVVCDEPRGFEHQLDLGEAWKRATGLPFVFAVWMARDDADLDHRAIFEKLETAKREGMQSLDSIIETYARPLGWTVNLAHKYLTQHLKFDIGTRQIEAIETFHRLAAQHQLIDAAHPLRVWSSPS